MMQTLPMVTLAKAVEGMRDNARSQGAIPCKTVICMAF